MIDDDELLRSINIQALRVDIEKLKKENADSTDTNKHGDNDDNKFSNTLDQKIGNQHAKELVVETKKSENNKKIKSQKQNESIIKNPAIEIPLNKKESLIITFIGHVDAGKSTMCGNILIQTGRVDQRLVEKYKSEAAERKMDSWYLSYLMDTTEEERSRGKTVSCGYGLFSSSKRNYFIVDAPGHQGYITEMITGSSYADVAVLVVSSRTGEFESGFERGGQTKEHALLVRTLGVEKVVVFVNKIDSCNYSQQRYDDIVQKIRIYLKQFYDVKNDVFFLPGSAYLGINLVENRGECEWYKGPALLPLLDTLKLNERDVKSPLRIIVGEIKKDFNTMTFYGKIIVGAVKNKYIVLLMPDNIYLTIYNIKLESNDQLVDDNNNSSNNNNNNNNTESDDGVAIAGDNIIFQLSIAQDLPSSSTNSNNNNFDIQKITSGSILCAPDCPAKMCKRFYAEFLLLSGELMIPGFRCMMHLLNETREIVFDKAIKVYDKSKKEWLNYGQQIVRPGMKVKARFSTNDPVVLEEFDEFPSFARFNMRKNEETIGIGKVIRIPRKEKE